MPVSTNLSLRISAILLGGFVLFQILLVVLLTLPSRGDAERPYNLPRPEQVRAMAAVFDLTPRAERPALVGTFNGSLYSVGLADVGPAVTEPSASLEQLRQVYAGALAGRVVRAAGRRPLLSRLIGEGPRPARFFAPVRLAVALRDGQWLTIDSTPSAAVRGYLRQRSTMGAIGGLIVLGALGLAVRQTTRPLIRLSDGVRHFSQGLDAPDVPVEGPQEIRALAHAFNDMKARIGGLMAERTRMLAAIAHDMRTYLTRLRLRAEFIADPAQREAAVRDLDEMTSLLADTMLLAREDAEAASDAVPLDAVEQVRAIVDIRTEMGDAVVFEAPATPARLLCTPIALRRMLANLIDNGLRHGSQVTVRVLIEPATVQLVVTDNGPGVPAKALARLGEPFHRLDPSRDRESGGAGLGLAIVRALAQRYRGEVTFDNRPEGGFRATLRFPRLPEA